MTACVGKIVLSAISTKFCCFKCLCLPSATFIGFGFSSPLPLFFYGAVFELFSGSPDPDDFFPMGETRRLGRLEELTEPL